MLATMDDNVIRTILSNFTCSRDIMQLGRVSKLWHKVAKDMLCDGTFVCGHTESVKVVEVEGCNLDRISYDNDTGVLYWNYGPNCRKRVVFQTPVCQSIWEYRKENDLFFIKVDNKILKSFFNKMERKVKTAVSRSYCSEIPSYRVDLIPSPLTKYFDKYNNPLKYVDHYCSLFNGRYIINLDVNVSSLYISKIKIDVVQMQVYNKMVELEEFSFI